MGSDDNALCGPIVQSKRGLLACGWTIVVLLTISAFISAITFSTTTFSQGYNYDYNEEDDNEGNDQDDNRRNDQEGEYQSSSLNGPMAFAATWTAILALAISIVGCIVLGMQGPRGQWYSCCHGSIYRTNSGYLGMFIGALFMMANVTLICAILFGKFNIRSYDMNQEREGEHNREEDRRDGTMDRSSIAFAILCSFLTILYMLYAVCLFISRQDVLDEYEAEERAERLSPSVWIDNAFAGRREDERSNKSSETDYKLTKLLGGGRGGKEKENRDDSSKQSKGFFKSLKKKNAS